LGMRVDRVVNEICDGSFKTVPDVLECVDDPGVRFNYLLPGDRDIVDPSSRFHQGDPCLVDLWFNRRPTQSLAGSGPHDYQTSGIPLAGSLSPFQRLPQETNLRDIRRLIASNSRSVLKSTAVQPSNSGVASRKAKSRTPSTRVRAPRRSSTGVSRRRR